MSNTHESMPGFETAPPFMEYFEVADRELVLKKLYMIRDNPILPELWTDCDHTLTEHGQSLWLVMSEALSPELQADSKAERKIRLKKEGSIEGLTNDEHEAWSANELDRHIRNGTTIGAIRQLMSTMKLRDKVWDLFQYLQERGMESHVLSGNTEVSIACLELPGAQVHANKVSTRYIAEEDDSVLVGFDRQNLVHGRNKMYIAAAVLAAAGVQGGQAPKVALGDNMTDKYMIPPTYDYNGKLLRVSDDTVLRIRMMQEGGNTPAYVAEALTPSEDGTHFDMVLNKGSVEGMILLFDWFADKAAHGTMKSA